MRVSSIRGTLCTSSRMIMSNETGRSISCDGRSDPAIYYIIIVRGNSKKKKKIHIIHRTTRVSEVFQIIIIILYRIRIVGPPPIPKPDNIRHSLINRPRRLSVNLVVCGHVVMGDLYLGDLKCGNRVENH